MVNVLSVFIIASALLFIGILAEYLFKRFGIPDILLLIATGFALGPFGFGIVEPSSIAPIAPIFTTFALLFLLFDGAFNIDIISFIKGIGKGMSITLLNFFVSAIVITGITLLFGIPLLQAMLLGFILGGISSAFVIPIIKNLRIKRETYTILTLESAITDVLCIVAAITLIEIITLNHFSTTLVLKKLTALFVIAGILGILAGIVWIVVIKRIFKKFQSYMLTIAYVLLLYTITEYLNGNGALATLFFGLVLQNSKKLIAFVKKEGSFSVTSPQEKLFYNQISFFLKTFFFAYIGILLDFSNHTALIIGAVIGVTLLITRHASRVLTKGMLPYDRSVINAIFARGLAAAVLAQVAIGSGIENADIISKVTITTIMFTIILSSVHLFTVNHQQGKNKMVSRRNRTRQRPHPA
ncbi:MAG: cation:proton antiporter [Nanoarchaeota archaeon]